MRLPSSNTKPMGQNTGGEESSPSCRWCSQSSFIQSSRSKPWATVELAFHLFPLSANRWIPYWIRHKATLFSLPSITHLRPLIYFFPTSLTSFTQRSHCPPLAHVCVWQSPLIQNTSSWLFCCGIKRKWISLQHREYASFPKGVLCQGSFFRSFRDPLRAQM